MAYGASSQPALDQLLVPSLQMFGPEPLQTNSAEMWDDLTLALSSRYRSSVFGDCACAPSNHEREVLSDRHARVVNMGAGVCGTQQPRQPTLRVFVWSRSPSRNADGGCHYRGADRI